MKTWLFSLCWERCHFKAATSGEKRHLLKKVTFVIIVVAGIPQTVHHCTCIYTNTHMSTCINPVSFLLSFWSCSLSFDKKKSVGKAQRTGFKLSSPGPISHSDPLAANTPRQWTFIWRSFAHVTAAKLPGKRRESCDSSLNKTMDVQWHFIWDCWEVRGPAPSWHRLTRTAERVHRNTLTSLSLHVHAIFWMQFHTNRGL